MDWANRAIDPRCRIGGVRDRVRPCAILPDRPPPPAQGLGCEPWEGSRVDHPLEDRGWIDSLPSAACGECRYTAPADGVEWDVLSLPKRQRLQRMKEGYEGPSGLSYPSSRPARSHWPGRRRHAQSDGGCGQGSGSKPSGAKPSASGKASSPGATPVSSQSSTASNIANTWSSVNTQWPGSLSI